jgi:uncharacterized membrane protein YkgB
VKGESTLNRARRIGVNAGQRSERSATALLHAAATPERLLRLSLGIVYLWFGALKVMGVSPVIDLIRHSYPVLATPALFVGLGLFEVALAVALISGLWKPWTAAATVCHMIGTFGVFVFSPQVAFAPHFPCLTITGEFVAKNVVLISAALVLWREAVGPARVRARGQE